MKTMNRGSLLLVVLLALGLAGCGEKSTPDKIQNSPAMETAVEHAAKHLDPKYVCPMHSNIVRDAPGNCPICGMQLVLKPQEPPAANTTSSERKLLYYQHPHKPGITADKPMKDEMGMDYVAVYGDSNPQDGATVRIAPQVVQNMGVRTSKVVKGRLVRDIDTAGTVEVNEQRVHHIHLRTQGWIERLYVSSEGERVKKGQLLFEVYSPELVNAQLEYIQASQVGSPRLVPVSRERLLAMGLAEKQIQRLDKTKKAEQLFQVYTPQDGIVEKLNVRHGMYVMPNTDVMIIANLDEVWILADVLERQSAWVKPGQAAQVHLDYLPKEKLSGVVEYVYPRLNPKTRTLRVRLRFPNPGEILKPDMFARVTLHVEEKQSALLIPREAVIRTSDTSRVILSLGEGKFSAREVQVGLETSDNVEIIAGLQEAEEVVTSGQFLLDSEASLKAGLQRLQTEVTKPAGQVNATAIVGRGVLHTIGNNKVTITHAPIAALQWSAMTMDFTVASAVVLTDLKPEDQVEFELQKINEAYVITAIRKLQP